MVLLVAWMVVAAVPEPIPPATPPPPPAVRRGASRSRDATPLGDPGNWVLTSDYPADALREARQGISLVRFDVTKTGAIANCAIVRSSGAASLDIAACAALTARARYRPALDARGDVIVVSRMQRIRWQLPPAARDRFAPDLGGTLPASAVESWVVAADFPPESRGDNEYGVAFLRLEIDERGRVLSCLVEQGTGFPRLDRASCARIRERATFQAAIGISGKPIHASVRLAVNWSQSMVGVIQ